MSFHTHRACLICSYALHLFLTTSPAPASEVRMVPRRQMKLAPNPPVETLISSHYPDPEAHDTSHQQ